MSSSNCCFFTCMQVKIISFAAQDGEGCMSSVCLYVSRQTAKTRPGADCGSDHELLIAKFRLKLRKVGKTTRPFRYDLNQIPYNYTVEVTNRFKGLDLINRVPEELWMEVCKIVQEVVIKTTPKKKVRKGNMSIWGGLTNSWEKKRSERQRRKGKVYPSECRVPKNSKWALGNITMNKDSGGNGIPAELFQILNDDAVTVLHSIWLQIWKIQQWL